MTDWDDLFDHLVADFDETRSSAAKSIQRLQMLVKAVTACKPETKTVSPDQFSVTQLVKELKTVERYIKTAVAREAMTESAKRLSSDDQQHGQAS